MRVPGSVLKLERTWMSTSCAAASSTARGCITPAPAAASWSIWSRPTNGQPPRLGHHPRVGGEHPVYVGVDLAGPQPEGGGHRDRRASEPPRPRVVTSPSGEMP